MSSNPSYIIPQWSAPSHVKAIQTTRLGGFSLSPYDGFNLGLHVGDDETLVARNRQLLRDFLPAEPSWLNQVHSTHVIELSGCQYAIEADASLTRVPHVVCTVMTADCLPILLCDQAGTVVAAVHAGWRGLCHGVIEETVKAMGVASEELIAWLGPAIGPDAFEVGPEVKDAFVREHSLAQSAFRPHQEKWLANLYDLARMRLNRLGIFKVAGGDECTYHSSEKFYSYRREGVTGRMATLIWLTGL
jgi:polyphenol oxidase